MFYSISDKTFKTQHELFSETDLLKNQRGNSDQSICKKTYRQCRKSRSKLTKLKTIPLKILKFYIHHEWMWINSIVGDLIVLYCIEIVFCWSYWSYVSFFRNFVGWHKLGHSSWRHIFIQIIGPHQKNM